VPRTSISLFRESSTPCRFATFGGGSLEHALQAIDTANRLGLAGAKKSQQLVDAGHFGAKSTKGIFDYTPESLEKLRVMRNSGFLQLAKFSRD
jgi:hypothetical protein